MRKSVWACGVLAMGLLLPAAGAFPAFAKRDKRPLDSICDPLVQSSLRSTPPVGLLIGGFDGNGDARIDRAELRAGTEHMFRLADQNSDGQISLIELSAWAATWLGGPSAIPGRFDFDRDQNDLISREEFAAELERRFNGFDGDKDNIVDRAELLTGSAPKNCVDGRLVPPADRREQPR